MVFEATEFMVEGLLPDQSQEAIFLTQFCKQNLPPWVSKAFKDLPVQKRKELIGNTNHCYCCLAAGYHSND